MATRMRSQRDPRILSNVAEHIPFYVGNVYGIDVPETPGRLPEPYRSEYRAANVVYTIVSYSTPIGWKTADGTIVVPQVTYSSSTSKHQALARRALAASVALPFLPWQVDRYRDGMLYDATAVPRRRRESARVPITQGVHLANIATVERAGEGFTRWSWTPTEVAR